MPGVSPGPPPRSASAAAPSLTARARTRARSGAAAARARAGRKTRRAGDHTGRRRPGALVPSHHARLAGGQQASTWPCLACSGRAHAAAAQPKPVVDPHTVLTGLPHNLLSPAAGRRCCRAGARGAAWRRQAAQGRRGRRARHQPAEARRRRVPGTSGGPGGAGACPAAAAQWRQRPQSGGARACMAAAAVLPGC